MRGLRWAAWVAALIVFSPSVIAGELPLSIASVFGRWENPHAKSGCMGVFEDVLVCDKAEKELIYNVPRPEIVGESSSFAGSHTESRFRKS